MIDHPMILSTTEPNNSIGVIKIRQYDKQTQTFVVTVTEQGKPVDISSLKIFFCLSTGTETGKGIVENDPVKKEQIIDSKNGKFKYTLSEYDWQFSGDNTAYFSFRTLNDDNSWKEQFTTRDFKYTVTKSIYSSGIKDSNYIWSFEDLLRYLNEFIDTGQGNFNDWWESIKGSLGEDPAGQFALFKISMSDYVMNVKDYGIKGDGIKDDTNAIKLLINTCPENSRLFFPQGIYKVTSNIIVSKKLNLTGVKPVYDTSSKLLKDGSIISGGGIYFKTGSSGSTISGLGIYTLNSTNGIDVHGVIDDINISNVVSKARDHAFLIESYNGLVSNITISDCESYDGIHGFIVKATKVIVENCTANNHNSWGIGIISDNIGSPENKGYALDSKVINCKSLTCGAGFIQYCRDYYSETLENGVLCDGNQFSNVTAIDCGIGLNIGDIVGDTGGGKYTSTYVTRTLVNGFTERNSTAKSVVLRNSKNCSISNTVIEKGMEISPADANQGLSINNNVGMKAGGFFDIQLLDKGPTPNVGFGNLFRTTNTESTLIQEFVGAVDGKRFKINLWDNLTKIIGNSKIYLTNGEFSGVGNSIEFIFQDGIYFEISRNQASPTVRSVNYVQNAGNLSISGTTLIDLYGSGTTDIKVKPVNFNPAGQEINIFIRSSSGNFTFGGFDSNLFVIPDNMLRTLNFGSGLMTKWAFVPNLSKFILIHQELSKYA